MEIEISQEEARVIPGETIDIGNADRLKKEVTRVIEEGYDNIILDFKNVESIDSSGLGKILLFHKMMENKDGEFKIVNVDSDYIAKIFSTFNLEKLITIE